MDRCLSVAIFTIWAWYYAATLDAREPGPIDVGLIALSGDPAPGYETFGADFTEAINSPVAEIGPAGHVLFFSLFSGSPTPPRGWFYHHDGSIENVWQQNQPLPRGPATERNSFSFLLSGVDFEGNIAFQSVLSCLDGGNAGNCDLPVNLVGPPASLVNFATANWQEPRIGSGSLAINEGGQVVATGRFFEKETGSQLREEIRHFFSSSGTGNTRAARSGWEVGVGAGEYFRHFFDIQITRDNEVFTEATLEDELAAPLNRRGIFRVGSFSEIELARLGVPAPGPATLGPLEWTSFQSWKATSNNHVALIGRVLVNGSSVNGLWSLRPENQQLVALPGYTSFENARPDELISNLATSEFEIGRDGGIVFWARTSLNRTGIFRWREGAITPLVLEGEPAPLFSENTTQAVSLFRTNPRGDVLVHGGVSGVGSILYLFETGETNPRIILRSGDLFEQRGEPRTVSGWSLPTSSVGRRKIFNDAGQLVVRMNSNSPGFTNGLFVLETSLPAETFKLDGADAVIPVKTVPGKRLGVRRTRDFSTFEVVANDITGNGETVEIRDAGAANEFESAFYIVVVEGDL